MLPGTPKIVINLKAVEYIDSGGLGVLVGLFVSARNRGGELKLVSPNQRIKQALFHALRLLLGWQVTIGDVVVPLWVSWIGLVIAVYLANQGFRLARTEYS
jgi:hypothetical protein